MYLYRNRIKQIIVVSRYWKNFLEKKGFTNVKLIYNSFNTNNYNCSKESVNNFKKKYNLITKNKIIYVGSIKEKKGYDLVYNTLKNEDYIFVGSGSDHCEIKGIKCFNLSFKEYLLLISSSDIVVLMSHFREGWNRIAHEAILLNKKVIGSGEGGMKELLELENRIICNDIKKLKHLVKNEINNNQIKNPIIVSKFDLNYFRSKWLEALN
jgi:glycosyltransferase involved in cell wall biosynthesis